MPATGGVNQRLHTSNMVFGNIDVYLYRNRGLFGLLCLIVGLSSGALGLKVMGIVRAQVLDSG